jgi:RNA polymerase sigma-70 factor (ECF subfamily)
MTPPEPALQPQESDETLMSRIAAGDRRAFQCVVGRYGRRAHALAQRMLFNRSLAEDTVQEAFTKIWVHAGGWDRDKAKFSTWFYRILTNACIDAQRKKNYRDKGNVALDDTMEIADPSLSAEQRLIAAQQSQRVREALAALPDRQRLALTLCYYEEMSNKQAAEVMGVHIKALEGLLMRARTGLKRTLAPLAQQEGAL